MSMSAHWISSEVRKGIKSLLFLWSVSCSVDHSLLSLVFPKGNIFRCVKSFLYFVLHVTPWAFVTGGIWWHFPLSIHFVWCHYSESRETLIYFFSWPMKEKEVCCEILMEPWQESLPTSQPLHLFYLPARSEFRKPHLH